MLALGLALAAAIGLTLGLLGGGGSILAVPVLVYVLGYPAKTAIAMSLPVVGITSLVGAALHWRLGNVRVGTAFTFGLIAMIGAFVGAKLSVLMRGDAQLALLAVVMTAAAASMLRRDRSDAEPRASWRPVLLAAVALGVGVLTGLVGIGGGFLVVPALVLLARVPMRQAVGTSLLVIAMNAAAGFAGHLGTVTLEWGALLGLTGAAAAGALAGTSLVGHVPQAALKRGFAVFLFAMSGFVLYGNRDAFRASAAPTATPSAAPAADADVARLTPR
jgi:uncharacterized membrane protein YfcA